MAPSERKKVLLKQSCSLDYEDTADSVKSMETTSVKNKNKGSSEAVVVKNKNKGSMETVAVKNKNNNLVERACSEDRGLRRRPKVVLIQSMRDSLEMFHPNPIAETSTNNWHVWFSILRFSDIFQYHPLGNLSKTF